LIHFYKRLKCYGDNKSKCFQLKPINGYLTIILK